MKQLEPEIADDGGLLRIGGKPKTLKTEAEAQVKQLEPEMADIGGLLRDARAALKKAKRVDYYAVLEVDTCADEAEIKKVGPCHCLMS